MEPSASFARPTEFIERRIVELRELRTRLSEELPRAVSRVVIDEIDHELRIVDELINEYRALRELESELAKKRN